MKHILILFLLINISLAQTPGYTGKKNIIELEVFGYPAIGNTLNYRNQEGYNGHIGLNLRSSLRLERVLSRTVSVGVSGGTFSTRAIYPYKNPKNIQQFGYTAINATPIHVFTRLYDLKRFGSLAPIGVYHQFDVFVLPYTIRDVTGKLDPGNSVVPERYLDGGVAYTIGVQRVFSSSFSYDIGAQIGLPFDLVGSKFGLSRTTTLDDMHSRGAARVLFHYMFNLKAGVGWVF